MNSQVRTLRLCCFVEVFTARTRVLVADDNQAIRDILTSILADEYAIRGVSDGGAAFAAAR
jgi:CheY-like chemotaxis protein